MSLDEYIYGKFVKFLNHKKQDQVLLSRQVLLDDIKPRLTVMARALTGEAIELVPAMQEGGYKGLHFFLPPSFSVFHDKYDNLRWYIFRVLFLSVQRKLNYNWSSKTSYKLETSRKKAIETAPEVLFHMQQDFPFALELHQSLREKLLLLQANTQKDLLTWLYGKWMTDENQQVIVEEMVSKANAGAKKPSRAATTLKAKAVEEIVNVRIDKKSQEDYVMTHNFEKVETAEEFDGVWRDFDGEDELEDHSDALDELQMKYTVRADDTSHSVYQSEFSENTSIAESADHQHQKTHICYDEWDYRKSAYKLDFCKVFPESPSISDPSYYQKVMDENKTTLTELRKMLAHVNNKRRKIRYQIQGEDFDIDMVTDMFADLHHRQTPNEKLYYSSRKAEKDISIMLLLDNSMSTDSYAAGNRVIDVEKQVSILFGEILHEYGIDFSICSFSSHTRNHSSFLTLKAFDEQWRQARYKIGAVEPHGYTRIGVSIRHAGAILRQRPTKNKWLLFVSDGKPNDFDRYEGQYGIQDVKQSLRELSAADIHTFALAIEAQARYYLPQMFGQNHYQILTSPQELLRALVKLYTRIKTL